MSGYSRAAITAARECKAHPGRSPIDAWSTAVAQEFSSHESRIKGCPKGAFLGLCEEGLVKGIPSGDYRAGEKNKGYAVEAVRLLKADPSMAARIPELWKRISPKKHNSQLHVVTGLWLERLILADSSI